MRRKKRKTKVVEKLPIAREEARDEGPRLIPLVAPRLHNDESYFKRILELADIALKNPR